MKHYEFWFVVGSQTLYGDDVLTTVANRAEEMAQKLSAVLPYPLKYKGDCQVQRRDHAGRKRGQL